LQLRGLVRVLLDRQGAEIDSFIVGILERVEDGRGGDVEDRPGIGIELEFRGAIDHESGRSAAD